MRFSEQRLAQFEALMRPCLECMQQLCSLRESVEHAHAVVQGAKRGRTDRRSPWQSPQPVSRSSPGSVGFTTGMRALLDMPVPLFPPGGDLPTGQECRDLVQALRENTAAKQAHVADLLRIEDKLGSIMARMSMMD